MRHRSAAAATLALGMLLFWSCEPGKPNQPPDTGDNHSPTARINGPETAREGATVGFSALESTDPDPADTLDYTWFPGDGRTFTGTQLGGTTRQWSYADNGVYTVTVIVTDRAGAADTASTSVTIVNTPPYVAHIWTPTQQAVGFSAPFQVSVSDSGGGDTFSMTIAWGDGTSDSVASPREAIVKHSYAQPGSYTVRVTVRDDDGGVGSGTAERPAIVFDPSERKFVAGYEVFDLGTLGGSWARPSDINDRGQIVGMSVTAAVDTHAFVWQNGLIRDLGTLGNASSAAHRINNDGLIAGGVWTGFNAYGLPKSVPATWVATSGAGQTLGTQWPITAAAINESGEIAWFTSGYEFGFGWFSRGGTWQQMGSLLGGEPPPSTPNAINERGQVVGMSPAAGETVTPDEHAFLWEDGTMRDLGLLGLRPCRSSPDKRCGTATATGINENGQIAGWSTAADGFMHAVLWANGTIKDLWTEPDSSTGNRWRRWAFINDAGQIAGSGNGEGFFWSGGSVRSLGSLGGGGTVVADLNEAGAVAGTSMTANGEQHGFVWTAERGMIDLGTGPAGFGCAWVVGISFGGDIVGYAAPTDPYTGCGYHGQQTRAVMWRRSP